MNNCPRCVLGIVPDAPALSRTDNKTRICSACGLIEGIEQMLDCLTPQSEWGVELHGWKHDRVQN